ncbi:MAG TPA: hypothetical protein VGP70_18270 [Actinomadura sp.]|jgi:hypothetical protein|nr:hypothetical protein [Actinomadura sp.]
MLRLYDPRTGKVEELPPTRLLRLHVSGPDLRAYIVTDVVRRLAEHHRRQVMVSAPAPRDLTTLNIPPMNQDTSPEADLHVGGATGSGRAVPVGPSGAEPDLASITGQGLDPLSVRLVTLRRPYREPLELDRSSLEEADDHLRRLRAQVAGWAQAPSKAISAVHRAEAVRALDADLDTPGALEVLRRLADSDVPPGSKFETVSALDMLLALDLVRDVGRPPSAAP